MTVLFREIEDVQRLKKLNAELTRRVTTQAPYSKRKIVGYPSGREEFPIQFESRKGQDVRWWSTKRSGDGAAIINLVGSGDPDSENYLLIDLQFNIPVQRFDRRHGASFVEELATRRVYLAHRGIVSRGKSRVKREDLLAETTHEMVPVATSSGRTDLLIVAPLDSTTLFDDIARFGHEIRRAAKVAMGDETPTSEPTLGALSSRNFSAVDQNIRGYFDEFEGVRKSPARRASKVFVQHGSIVRQLADALQSCRLHKSQLIDLLAEGANEVCVYEVKTASDRASIYTAIGQLSLHALASAKRFPKKGVRKVFVVPAGVSDEFKALMRCDLGIEVLCFHRKDDGTIEFDSIDKVSPKR